jgi:hypothetical protein
MISPTVLQARGIFGVVEGFDPKVYPGTGVLPRTGDARRREEDSGLEPTEKSST